MDHIEDNNFQVAVKALFFESGKLMMIKEASGVWELPGGRIQKGENFIDALKRECLEETGLECEVLEEHPCIAYATVDQDGRDRIMLYFKIKLASLDFKKSDECVEIKFYDKSEISNLQIPPQLKDLPGYL